MMHTFKQYLQEKRITLMAAEELSSGAYSTFEVEGWENPSISEILAITKKNTVVRFLVHKNGTMYAWPGRGPAIHSDIDAGEFGAEKSGTSNLIAGITTWGMFIHSSFGSSRAKNKFTDKEMVIEFEGSDPSAKKLMLGNRVLKQIHDKHQDRIEWRPHRTEY